MSGDPSYISGKVTGSCACKRITFETTTLPNNITSCYCTECSKVSGAGYLRFGRFPMSKLKWSAQPKIWKSSDMAERGHCSTCGSSVLMRYFADEDEIYINMSMIDSSDVPLPKTKQHIFVDEMAEWVQVADDGAKRFAKFPKAT